MLLPSFDDNNLFEHFWTPAFAGVAVWDKVNLPGFHPETPGCVGAGFIPARRVHGWCAVTGGHKARPYGR
jgi:hypothetical protein